MGWLEPGLKTKLAPVRLRLAVTALNTTVTELAPTVMLGDPATAGAPAGMVILCDGGVAGSRELPFASTSDLMVTVIVPATVPWLNCELFPDHTAVVAPAGIV